MIKELSSISEVTEIKNVKIENFKQIKPENGMTGKDAKSFWDKELNNIRSDSNEVKKSETSEKAPPEKIKCINENLEGQTYSKTGVPYEKRIVEVDGKEYEVVVPKFESKFDAQLPDDKLKSSDFVQFRECNNQLKEAVEKDPELSKKFDAQQLEQIRNGETPDGCTWNHDADVGKMQLVDSEKHQMTPHTGGRKIWGGGSDCR